MPEGAPGIVGRSRRRATARATSGNADDILFSLSFWPQERLQDAWQGKVCNRYKATGAQHMRNALRGWIEDVRRWRSDASGTTITDGRH